MASVFNALGVGRIGQILSRALAMDDANPAPALGGELVPGIILENDRPEWGYLSDELRYGGGGLLNASALVNSGWCLRNPAGSGALCIVERVLVSTAANTVIFQGLELVDTDFAGVVPHAALDTRAWPVGGVRRSSMSISAGTGVTPGGNGIGSTFVLAAAPCLLSPVVLGPGSRMWFYTNDINTSLTAQIVWRARAATSTELVR